MAHQHDHGPRDYGRAFAIGVSLNLVFVLTEAGFGLVSHSLALVADAGHNLSDVLGLLLAWGAALLTRRLPTHGRTYGWRGTTILAALVNAVTLIIALSIIGWEAVGRLRHPQPVTGMTVIWVAAVGIVINTVTALLFRSGREHDLNLRGAYLHMAADAAVSLGVVLAGIALVLTGQRWIDPVVSLAIVAIVFAGTWGLLRDSVNLALDAVPPGVDQQAVTRYLEELAGVTEVHDLHIWAMSTTETALTAHLVRPDATGGDALLASVCQALHERFGIEHATLQLEQGDPAHPCRLAAAATV